MGKSLHAPLFGERTVPAPIVLLLALVVAASVPFANGQGQLTVVDVSPSTNLIPNGDLGSTGAATNAAPQQPCTFFYCGVQQLIAIPPYMFLVTTGGVVIVSMPVGDGTPIAKGQAWHANNVWGNNNQWNAQLVLPNDGSNNLWLLSARVALAVQGWSSPSPAPQLKPVINTDNSPHFLTDWAYEPVFNIWWGTGLRYDSQYGYVQFVWSQSGSPYMATSGGQGWHLQLNNPCFTVKYRPTPNGGSYGTMMFGCTGTVIVMNTQAYGYSMKFILSTYFPSDVPASYMTTYAVGTGNYTSALYYQPTDTLYLGSGIGLGLAVDASTFSIKQLFFIQPSTFSSYAGLTSVYLDSTGSEPVLFWGTTQGSVHRTLMSTFEVDNQYIFDTQYYTSQVTQHPNNNDKLLMVISPYYGYANVSRILEVTKGACSSTCGGCNADPYCGYCYATGSCTTQKTCIATSSSAIWNRLSTCPGPPQPVVPLTPSGGPIFGGTPVIVYGGYFNASEFGNYKCVWSNSSTYSFAPVPVSSITPTSVTCSSPAVTNTSPLTVSIVWKSAAWSTGSGSFAPYDCALLSCGQCISTAYPLCGWCFQSQTCAFQSKCPTYSATNALEWNTGGCPSVVNPYTSVAPSDKATNLTVSVANFPFDSNTNFYCQIDGSKSAATIATHTTSAISTFNCQSPADMSLTNANNYFNLDIVDSNDKSWTNSVGIGTIDLVVCPAITQCAVCSRYPGCTWCQGAPGACYFADSLPPAGCPLGSCPAINNTVPPSSLVGATPVIALNGEAFSNTGSSLTCTLTANGYPTVNVNATYTNSTLVNCDPLPPSTPAADYSLSLNYQGQQLTNSISYLVYDCAQSTTCSDCAEVLKPACHWCASPSALSCTASTCGAGAVVTSANSTSCPTLTSVSPAGVALSSTNNLTMTGDFSLLQSSETSALACAVGSPSSVTASSAIIGFTGTTTIHCGSIAVGSTAGNVEAFLYSSSGTNHLYANVVPFGIEDCTVATNCSQCLSLVGCHYCAGSCSSSACTVASQEQTVCPVFSDVYPDYVDTFGNNTVSVQGTNFLVLAGGAKRTSHALQSANALQGYTCVWGNSIYYSAGAVTSTSITCKAPPLTNAGFLSLDILLNGQEYISTTGVTVFVCPFVTSSACNTNCTSASYCGWCVSTLSCTGQQRCGNGLWEDQCFAISEITPDVAPLIGGGEISIALTGEISSNIDVSALACNFKGQATAANFSTTGNTSSVTCSPPQSVDAFPNEVTVSVSYVGNDVAGTSPFNYIDCSSSKSCSRCIQNANCGWCTATSTCAVAFQCAGEFRTNSCPLNTLALGLGLGLGLFFAILIGLLLFFLIRRAIRRRGLIINLTEPDYDAIAFSGDTTLLYRIPDHNFKTLNLMLARKDYLLQIAMAINCPSTEQESLAKALVYVASSQDVTPEMIKTVIRAEVASCKDENTLFRNNSVASKMYKFYSRIVGIKYLFHCIARVIVELEVLGRKQQAFAEGGSSAKPDNDKEVSLLDVSMELDTSKAITDDVDSDTNIIQLQLICQKIITVLIKTSLTNIPSPLRQIFVEIDRSVSDKFPYSVDAVYKGLGGLFFLRFVCPAISAPHVYGLLQSPPNSFTQRQLVLITKVIQSIANMQPPGKKEQYMEVMGGFINSSIPRIKKFYDHLRTAANINRHTDIYEREINVPDTVLLNGLAATQSVLVTQKDKILAWAPTSHLDPAQQEELAQILQEAYDLHPTVPKKLRSGGADGEGNGEPSGGGKKKKKKSKS